MDIMNFTWGQLSIAFVILIIPALILWKFKTGLLTKMGIAVVRMTIQLLFVGYYLEYLFRYDNTWLNLGWILVMVIVADFATIDRSELKRNRYLIFSIFIATFLGVLVIDVFFLKFVIQLPNIMTAQYAIPITGMVLGNCLQSNVIGINTFYYSIDQHQERYRFFIANGSTQEEALFPFFRNALKKSANPTLASMATIGLVSLPGMMTGQILSGSSPFIAIKYQIMIMLAIFSGTVLSVYLGIVISSKFVFNERNNFDKTIVKKD
ncbi:iron export ABC transporter permease subunit FetB [Gelidibacter salicanalis]|uniref:Iron export ABC transporter permease subunit FetB n=1 Tax=Gelidibacter salicanalis TaxID=291193 RepID=A0A5C7AQ96_9FLAO|nr:iron export ABC transporter permease subunit FetB [Gelidibacter salicanalis]TXE10778.1 iron export ABC transporter permease subunit FetB [Gelidibacter salicanalis]